MYAAPEPGVFALGDSPLLTGVEVHFRAIISSLPRAKPPALPEAQAGLTNLAAHFDA